ncbi:hypothetical protein M405DRAFT_771486 [Rhizopogon salebrosus TDB-379]|nr:hypothetical protein M405DRAFT_771486 [Rhizopogon salebrosus TDB-379]
MFTPPASLISYKTKGRDIEWNSGYVIPVPVVPVSRSPSPNSHAAPASSMPACGPMYNESALPDTVALLPHHLRKQSSQPSQQQARGSAQPSRRRVHSPYSTVRRPVNANWDKHLNNQMEAVWMTKASFRPKRKKALCIGINYIGQGRELRGCVNDAWNMSEFLKSFWNYAQEDIMVLTDEPYLNPKYMPTKRNILNALRWLVKDAQPGDCLFFHFSGHGGRIIDSDGPEKAIHPVDWELSGEIVSEILYDIMVKPLPTGCRLTALFDSCHSGTVLDLPYIYQANGRLESQAMNSQALAKYPSAQVVLFAGCGDLQGSGGIIRGGEFLGAMSAAFISSITANFNQTCLQVLASVKDILHQTQRQTPQLSSSYPIDANRRCLL